MVLVTVLTLILYFVVMSAILEQCPIYDEDRICEAVIESSQAESRRKARIKRRENKPSRKVRARNMMLNEEFEERFYTAVMCISNSSIHFVNRTFEAYRPDNYESNYFDNTDAVALLELVEEEAYSQGSHPSIAVLIQRCVA